MTLMEDLEAELISDYIEYLIQCVANGNSQKVPKEWLDIVMNELKREA